MKGTRKARRRKPVHEQNLRVAVRSVLVFLLFLTVLPMLLTGCWDKREIEQNAYVIGLGIDQSEQEGMFEMTYLIQNPQVGSSDIATAENEPASEALTLTVPDWVNMRDTAESIVSREIEFSHVRVLVVGEEMAKSGKLLPFLQGVIRDPNLSRVVNLVVTREKASDFFQKHHAKMETRPHKFFDLMALRWKANGLLTPATLNRFFYKNIEGSPFFAIYASAEEINPAPEKGLEDNYLPGEILQIGEDETQFIGAAVFQKGKMVGSMTGEEVRYYHYLMEAGEAGEMLASFPDPLAPEYRLVARISETERARVQVDVHRDTPRIRVEVPIDAELLSIPSQVNYVSDSKKQERLKRSLEEEIETKAKALVKKTQEQFQGDPFMWFLKARRQFWTWKAFENYHWSEKYQQADVKVNVQLTFTGFGKENAPRPFERKTVKVYWQ